MTPHRLAIVNGYFAPPRAEPHFTSHAMRLEDSRRVQRELDARRTDPTELTFTTRDALTRATVNGAKALGMDDRLGSLAPGKQADVIVVGPGNERLNMLGLADHVGAVVQQANASNVQTVLVAGKPVKRDGRLLDVDLGRIAAPA